MGSRAMPINADLAGADKPLDQPERQLGQLLAQPAIKPNSVIVCSSRQGQPHAASTEIEAANAK